MLTSLQLLKRNFDDTKKPAGNVFIHVGINAEDGFLTVELRKGAKQPVPDA